MVWDLVSIITTEMATTNNVSVHAWFKIKLFLLLSHARQPPGKCQSPTPGKIEKANFPPQEWDNITKSTGMYILKYCTQIIDKIKPFPKILL